MRDNLDSLSKSFRLDVNTKYAGGSVWRCLKCGVIAHSMELFLPCQNDFIPSKVLCMECGTSWRLNLEPTEEELKILTGDWVLH